MPKPARTTKLSLDSSTPRSSSNKHSKLSPGCKLTSSLPTASMAPAEARPRLVACLWHTSDLRKGLLIPQALESNKASPLESLPNPQLLDTTRPHVRPAAHVSGPDMCRFCMQEREVVSLLNTTLAGLASMQGLTYFTHQARHFHKTTDGDPLIHLTLSLWVYSRLEANTDLCNFWL